jgi:hypothetical protein
MLAAVIKRNITTHKRRSRQRSQFVRRRLATADSLTWPFGAIRRFNQKKQMKTAEETDRNDGK